MLCHDADKLMKAVLARTKTKCFTDIIEVAFVGDEVKLQLDVEKDLPKEEEEEEARGGKSQTPGPAIYLHSF